MAFQKITGNFQRFAYRSLLSAIYHLKR